jgi:hypothetical protein
MDLPRLMRVKQFVAFTGLSRSRIYRLAKSGDIKLVRLGASTYVDVPIAMTYLDGLPDYRSERFKPKEPKPEPAE